MLIGLLLMAACNTGSSSAPAAGTGATLQTIAVGPANPTLGLGATVQLTATGTYSDSTTQDITSSVTWSSSNTAIATVSSTGLVTATGTTGQTVVIIATSGSVSGNTTVTLAATSVTLTSIAVTPVNPNLALGSTVSLTATGTYSDSSTQNITTSVTWSSSNTAVATVGASTGVVTPAGGATAGQTAVITATSGAVSGNTTVTLTSGSTGLPPYDVTTVSDPLTTQQWGLLNTGQNGFADNSGIANTGGTLGTDINVNPVYTTYGYTGTGVLVAVVDTGLDIAHEDLAANVVAGGSWDFVNGDTDPTNTVDTTGDHGTSVGGLIAMAKNGIGGIGVASKASLKGFNALSSGFSADFIASLGGSASSPNSQDVMVFNQSFGMGNEVDITINPADEAQYLDGVTNLRSGKGAIYVKSAGNGFRGFGSGPAYCTEANTRGVSCQNASFDPANTLPYNIVMAALNAKGLKSSYSTAGSAVWVATPGGEYGYNASVASGLISVAYDPAMVTADQSGCTSGYSRTAATSSAFNIGGANVSGLNTNCHYTNTMNGTSSAAPMMSGVIALILEANPALTWREVKDILARTAVKVDASIAPVTATLGTGGTYTLVQGWITNGAGLHYHNWYGFGAVNAKAAVDMAKTYPLGTLAVFASTGWIDSGALSLSIPDDSTTGVSVSFSSVPTGTVEAAQVMVTTSNASLGYTGDLAIELTSPSGTKSILKTPFDGFSSTNLSGMVLASNAFYGESSAGTWTVKVLDGWAGGTQSLTNVQLRLYGH